MAALSELHLVKQHLLKFFAGHDWEEFQFSEGPMVEAAPWFRVLRFAPGPRLNLWAYVTLGACALRDDENGLEFSAFVQHESPRFVELLTMTAYYHQGHQLGVGHTVSLGEPWVEGSKCNCSLISLPYPLGPDFEVCNTKKNHIHILWALPITEDERDFKIKNGLEEIESTFDRKALEFWDLKRKSVV
jgi:hypothetical protein